MFGVFNAYEQQVLRDWIEAAPAATAANRNADDAAGTVAGLPRILSHRARQRMLNIPATQPDHAYGMRGVLRRHASNGDEAASGFGADLRLLEERLAAQGNKKDTMAMLIKLMAPSVHPSAAGLMATRIFRQMLD